MDDPSRRPDFGREPSETKTTTSATPSTTTSPNPSTTPRPTGQFSASGSTARRQVTSLACNECRRVKCKCDGERPTCGFCQRKGLVCDYDPGHRGRTALMAARHEIKEHRDQNTVLLEQNNQLRELLRLIAIMSPSESTEILSRLRANEDPISVLQLIQHARIMLPQKETAGIPSSATTSGQTPDNSTMNSPTDSIPLSLARPDQAQTQQGPVVRRGPVDLNNLLNPQEDDDSAVLKHHSYDR